MTALLNRRQVLSLTAATLLPLAAHASWPQRPVRIVVPFAPGAGTDAMGRLLAQKLGEVLGASFVVENRPGASGAIGAQHVAQSAPDGYSLLLIAAPFTTVAAVLPQAGYDPVRGIAPATLEMVAGQLDLVTGTIPALAPFVRDGRIKALAVTTSRRTPALPDVPSMAELGFAGFDVSNYFGLVAPRGTPAEVTDRINAALPRVLAMPDVQARFKTDALEPAALGAAALTGFLNQDFSDWQKVVASQGIKVDSV
jgi:tripartite-type tricarboxylate transporter receptor subunit TctC